MRCLWIRSDLVFSIEAPIVHELLDKRMFDLVRMVFPTSLLSRYCLGGRPCPEGLIDGVNYFALQQRQYLSTGGNALLTCLQSGASHVYLVGFDGPADASNLLAGQRHYKATTFKVTHWNWARKMADYIQVMEAQSRVTLVLDAEGNHPLRSVVSKVITVDEFLELPCHRSRS